MRKFHAILLVGFLVLVGLTIRTWIKPQRPYGFVGGNEKLLLALRRASTADPLKWKLTIVEPEDGFDEGYTSDSAEIQLDNKNTFALTWADTPISGTIHDKYVEVSVGQNSTLRLDAVDEEQWEQRVDQFKTECFKAKQTKRLNEAIANGFETLSNLAQTRHDYIGRYLRLVNDLEALRQKWAALDRALASPGISFQESARIYRARAEITQRYWAVNSEVNRLLSAEYTVAGKTIDRTQFVPQMYLKASEIIQKKQALLFFSLPTSPENQDVLRLYTLPGNARLVAYPGLDYPTPAEGEIAEAIDRFRSSNRRVLKVRGYGEWAPVIGWEYLVNGNLTEKEWAAPNAFYVRVSDLLPADQNLILSPHPENASFTPFGKGTISRDCGQATFVAKGTYVSLPVQGIGLAGTFPEIGPVGPKQPLKPIKFFIPPKLAPRLQFCYLECSQFLAPRGWKATVAEQYTNGTYRIELKSSSPGESMIIHGNPGSGVAIEDIGKWILGHEDSTLEPQDDGAKLRDYEHPVRITNVSKNWEEYEVATPSANTLGAIYWDTDHPTFNRLEISVTPRNRDLVPVITKFFHYQMQLQYPENAQAKTGR